MEKFRVPRREVEVSVLLADGQELEGVFYAPEAGPDGGPGRLLDRLNDPTEDFVPLSHQGENFLVNKMRVVWVQLGVGQTRYERADSEGAQEAKVRLGFGHERTLDGRLAYIMPPERSRLLDYLNAAEGFIPLLGEERATLINRKFVSMVQSLAD